MKSHSRVHYDVAQTWPEQMLEEIIRQLPLGLICTDLAGEVLFMNVAAQELLAFEIPAGEYVHHAREQRCPELPVEIQRGIEYFSSLLAQPHRRYTKPFPKLLLQNHAGYDIEFLLYCPLNELIRETRKQARILILLKSAKLMVPTADLAKRFSLTNRERQVLQYLIQGRARKEIAAELSLSEDTVRSYLRSLYEKLGVSSRVEAATLGLRMELLENLKSVMQVQK
ncbi:MAG TPA: LuxR C-terminal-related transcriptional regulator [Candidatus Tectomicrobia bacterium]|nr:LuxR C-terminal-related transcriptional regulator [Candidatus Tectomicrobia bacterium]